MVTSTEKGQYFIMRQQTISKGIILAAGQGTRLSPITTQCPKVLLPIYNQEPLIASPIRSLEASGIREIAVIIGYQADKVMQRLGDGSQFGVKLHYITNSDYLGGNAISVLAAKEWTQGKPVVLCMGDHLIDENVVRLLLNYEELNDTLCIDYMPEQHCLIEEATKVMVTPDSCIRDIGKDLTQWDAIDTGIFLLTARFFLAIQVAVRYRGIYLETADIIRFMISKGHRFHTCDVSGCFWMDVDEKDDLDLARCRR